jgi:DNA-binding PadR family transcriptional regulator
MSPQTRSLIAALMKQPRQWRHGYDLAKETDLSSGSLYPILMRLTDRGLLEADWEESEQPGRPPRHIYRLTPDGIVAARELAGPSKQPASRKRLAPNSA